METLGLLCIAKKDQFTYYSVPIEAHFQYKKQNLLKKILPLFDPLGFLAQYVTRAKVVMQDLWVSGKDWDEELTKECKDAAVKRFQDLNELPHIKVPTCLVP